MGPSWQTLALSEPPPLQAVLTAVHMIRKVPELSNLFLPPCAQLLRERHHGKTTGILVLCLSSG